MQLSFGSRTPGLLVSVRSAGEARIALAAGADVIDVKEPTRGSLGAADPDEIAAVVAEVGGRVPVSAAAGELRDWTDEAHSDGAAARRPIAPYVRGIDFVKLGLARCETMHDWVARWRNLTQCLAPAARPVAVAYADWRQAAAPPPRDVLAAAISADAPALLVDTWEKSAGSLFDHWAQDQAAAFCRQVRGAGLVCVLAGSLRDEQLIAAARCRPNLIAVRGAVCEGGRGGPISFERVAAVRAAIRDSAEDDQPDRCHTGVTATLTSTPR